MQFVLQIDNLGIYKAFFFFSVVVEKFVVPLLVFRLSSFAYSVHQYIRKKEKKITRGFPITAKGII